MRLFTFTERVYDKIVALHHVSIPEWSESFKSRESPYWQIGTYNAFCSAQSKILNKHINKNKNYNVPRWFYGISKVEHDYMQKFNTSEGFDMYQGVPVFNHASMWEFYKSIGWDYKKKRFIV